MACDGSQAAAQFNPQEARLCRIAPVGQRRALGSRGGAGIDQFLQLQERLGWRRQRSRLERLAHQSQQPGIDSIGLGEAAASLGEQARAQRIDNGHGKACRMQRTLRGTMVLAGRFHHHPCHPQAAELSLEASPAAVVVGNTELSSACGHIRVQPLFTHIDASIDWRHRVRFGQYLALHAGLAPHHLFRTSARTSGPSSSPVLSSQGAHGPVRPIPGGWPSAGDRSNLRTKRCKSDVEKFAEFPDEKSGRGNGEDLLEKCLKERDAGTWPPPGRKLGA